MNRTLRRLGEIAWIAGLMLGISGRALAQDRSEEALALVSDAMDAYSNLEMDQAKRNLDQALGMKDNVDDVTLAKVHIGYGVLWAGGYSNTDEAKQSFMTAICLDEEASVDPLFSTPEIDQAFAQSRDSISPATCRELGVAPAVIPPCGRFESFTGQRRGYEIPFYVEVDSEISVYLSRIAVKYAFDGKVQYRTLDMSSIGGGNAYGAMVSCDRGEIATVNPGSVQFYIEGYDAADNVLCTQGTEASPLEVTMSPEASVISRPGLSPSGCTDETKKAAGAPCALNSECKTGLVCSAKTFTCAVEEEAPEETPSAGRGPKKFYVTLTGGTGVGYSTKPVRVVRFDPDADVTVDGIDSGIINGTDSASGYARGAIVDVEQVPKGGLNWSGVPIRLSLGYKINPKLSIELSGRLDGFIASNSPPVSCLDAANDEGASPGNMTHASCSTDLLGLTGDEGLDGPMSGDQLDEAARQSAAVTEKNDQPVVVTRKEYQVAWLINARARFAFLNRGGLHLSAFGGIGYGHIQYMVKDKTGDDYYSLPGMVNIEVGLGLAYYFTDNVGVIFDIPIDFLVGDSFALNFDFNLGLGFGF